MGTRKGTENLSRLCSGDDGFNLSRVYCVDVKNDITVLLDSGGWGIVKCSKNRIVMP